MFVFKKTLAYLASPTIAGFALAVVGVILLWTGSRQGIGRILATLGVGLLFLISLGPVANAILRPLEHWYPVYEGGERFRNIVVLGGGRIVDRRLPVSSQLTDASRARILDGVRLYRSMPGARLILTGHMVAPAMARMALDLGVPEADLVQADEPLDTKDEARTVRRLLGDQPFLLVTSASHMPRAMGLFRKQGLDPTPVPVRHLIQIPETAPWIPRPAGRELRKTERAVYEYLGILWAKLRGQI